MPLNLHDAELHLGKKHALVHKNYLKIGETEMGDFHTPHLVEFITMVSFLEQHRIDFNTRLPHF